MENIETQMVVWFIGYVGEHGPLDESKLFDELLKKGHLGNILGGWGRLFQRVKDQEIGEQGPDGRWHLTKSGEALYIVARGKLPKGSKTFEGIGPSTAQKIKAAFDEARGGQKEASQ
jgi:hypothetical protein